MRVNFSRRYWMAGAGAVAGLLVFAPRAIARTKLKVSLGDSSAYPTLQAAFAALPDSGGDIEIAPGTYREKLLLEKSDVHLIGLGDKPDDVVIVWDDSHVKAGGTGKSASLTVRGDSFSARNLTIQNDYQRDETQPDQQAVALFVTADRAVFEKVRFLGRQDTLYAASRDPKNASRQYYKDCFIEGHVDFIFGNASAYFDRCHINVLKRDGCCITAQSNNGPDEKSAYIFDGCTITAVPEATDFYLGRAWRPYARVVFLDTRIDAPLNPEGWREWTPGVTDTWKTAYFAEFNSSGRGASDKTRVSWSHVLSADEARQWRLQYFFGDPSWIARS